MRRLVLLLLTAALAGACTSSQPSTFSLTSAAADPTYWCPGNANDAPYDVHATVGVRNGTSSAVTITGVDVRMTLERVSGSWLEKVGDAYDAGSASFSPPTIGARSDATLKVKFRSACTSPAYGPGASRYGDYSVTLRVTTTAGSYSITASDLHRILAA